MIDDAQGQNVVGAGTMPFKLWPCQIKVMWDLWVERLVVILKARQLGISWLVCAYALWLCIFDAGKVVLCFSKGQDEADELIRRVQALYLRLPDWLREACPVQTKSNMETLEWANGSRVRSFSSGKGGGRSFTASLLILDEAAHMEFAESIYTAAKPTIDGGGQLIVLSSANGLSNLFHTLWVLAVSRASNFKAIFLPWWSRPGRDQAWYDQQVKDAVNKRTIPQEYPATAEEAFIASGFPVFNREKLVAILRDIEGKDPPIQGIQLPRAAFAKLRTAYREGQLKLYRLPINGHEYLVTADTAEGLDPVKGDDDDSGVWDLDTWEQVATLHGKWDTRYYGYMLEELRTYYNEGLLAIEDNNHGHAVIQAAEDAGCPPQRGMGASGMYYHRPEMLDGTIKVTDARILKPGWPTTAKSKDYALRLLATAIEEWSPDDPTMTFRDPVTVGQLMTFVNLGGGKTGGEGNAHDDAVTAAWIAAALLNLRFTRRGRGPVAQPQSDGAWYGAMRRL